MFYAQSTSVLHQGDTYFVIIYCILKVYTKRERVKQS